MRSLKDTIEYLTDRVNELKLENKQLSDELQEAMETIMDLTDELEERGEPFAYYIETELQDGSMEGSFIKADSMKYKYIADCCDMIGGPIALYK